MAMLNPMMTTDVAGNPCWMRPGGWTQVGFLKTMGCIGSVVKPHKWLLLKRPWEFVKELFRTYLVLPQLGRRCSGEIRAEQVASFSTPNRSEFVSVQRKCEALGGDGLVFRWQMQVDKRIGPSRLFLGRPEFD